MGSPRGPCEGGAGGGQQLGQEGSEMKKEKGYWVPAGNDLNILLILIILVIKILCRHKN